MANTSLKIGGNNWAVKEDSLLGYNVLQNKYVPIEIDTVRATTATRVNENGLIETVPRNLLTYSEQFDNVAWLKTRCTITSNDIVSPSGTINADKFTETTFTNNFSTLERVFNVTNGMTYSSSAFYKKGNINYASVGYFIVGGNQGRIIVDLDVKELTYSLSILSYKIEEVMNDYVRISITFTANFSGTCYFTYGQTKISNNINYNSDGTGFTYIWGAQLEANSTATDYFPTTDRLNIPRIDYSSGEASLLVEPQRTNLALRSEEFNDLTIWPGSAGVVRLANQGIAPDGTNTMDLITFPVALNSISQAISVTSGISYTFSIWLATQSGTQTVEIGNINSGVYETVIATTTPQRFEITQVASSATRYPAIRATANCSILLWGAQVEAGSNATSYIPTVASSVTRNADVISKTGISDLIGQTEGTIYLEANIQKRNESDFYIGISNGLSLGESIYLNQQSSGSLSLLFRTLGSSPSITVGSANWNIGLNKIAITYSGTLGEIFINGVSKGTVGLTAVPTCNRIVVGSRVDNPGTLVGGGAYKSVMLFKERLTDEQIILLTGDSYASYAEMANALNYIIQ